MAQISCFDWQRSCLRTISNNKSILGMDIYTVWLWFVVIQSFFVFYNQIIKLKLNWVEEMLCMTCTQWLAISHGSDGDWMVLWIEWREEFYIDMKSSGWIFMLFSWWTKQPYLVNFAGYIWSQRLLHGFY